MAEAVATGWDLNDNLVPVAEILSGGPPKDGIPALILPAYVPADDATSLIDEEPVLGVVYNGIARAYPLRILSWHELVNDDFGEDPLLVSW